MPAPSEVLAAYQRAKANKEIAEKMEVLGITDTFKFWATATEQAKVVAQSFLRSNNYLPATA